MRRSMSCGAYTLSIECNGKREKSGEYSRSGAPSRPHAAARSARAESAAPRLAFGAADEEVGEQRGRAAGAALAGTSLVGGAGDVQVRPGEPLGELGEIGCGRDRTAVAPADVGEVGEVALDLVGVFLGERQLPAAILGAHPRREQLVDELLVVAHDARVVMPERHHARAREGRDV